MVCQPLGLSVGYTNIKPEVFIFVQFLSQVQLFVTPMKF